MHSDYATPAKTAILILTPMPGPCGSPGPALRSRNQDPGIGDSPARGPAADRAGVRISARRDLAAELPVRRSVLDGNRQILGDQPGAISHKAVWGQSPDNRLGEHRRGTIVQNVH